jgi:hypothetical protein
MRGGKLGRWQRKNDDVCHYRIGQSAALCFFDPKGFKNCPVFSGRPSLTLSILKGFFFRSQARKGNPILVAIAALNNK